MADSDETDGGCLSALSCFKRRGKKRPEVSRSPKRAPAAVSPATNTAEPASTASRNEVSTSTSIHAESTAFPSVESRVPSSACIEDKPPTLASASDQNPATPDVSVMKVDLWQEAYADLDKKTREWIDAFPSVTNAQDPVYELVELVRCSEEKHTQEAPKLKIGNREIFWRDYANRVVSVLTAIGDVAIPFAPAPASTVWSAVKVLLAANVSQCKDLVAIMGCTDMVLSLVRRGRVYEEVYINEPPRPKAQEDLKQKLVEVYTTCLEFLAFVNQEIQRGNLGRFLDALMDPGHGEQRLSEIKSLQQEIDFAAHSCEAVAGYEHRRLLRSLEGPLKRIDNNVTEVLKVIISNEKKQAVDVIRNIMEYISNVPVGSHHNEKRESRTKDTCEWLVVHPKFLAWEGLACSSVFWLQGRIGTGKSFLSSKVIDRYWVHDRHNSQTSSNHDEGFAFFYCNRSDPTRQTIDSILRSYIRQLSEIPRRPESVHRVSYNLYEKRGGHIQSHISLDACETALLEMVNSYPRTTLVLDALDEMSKDTRGRLVLFFKRLVQKSKRLLKIFIASRPESDISEYLGSFQSPQMLVSISTSDNRGDIEKFVVAEMAAFSANWTSITSETRQRVKNTLVEKSDGMFRWTYLQWEQLKQFSTNGDIKRRLGKLPKTLSAAYDEIYDQYDPEGIERIMLQRAVRWVMCAHQALDSIALLSAIRVESEAVDGERALEESDLTEQTLATVCRHLVVRDLDLKVWKFPHASVAEYFGAKDELWVKDAQTEIATVLVNCMIDCCVAYPSVWQHNWDDGFTPRIQEGEVPDNTLDPRHPLQSYAQLHWYHHVQNVSNQDPKAANVVRALKRFLGDNGCQESSSEYQVFWNYVTLAQPKHYRSPRHYLPWGVDRYDDASPVTNSAFGIVIFGLHRLLSEWWDNGFDTSSLVNQRRTDLLTMAADYGDADLCEYLINRTGGINSNAQSKNFNALHMSIYRRHTDVTRVLLANGANPNRLFDHQSALCRAVGEGCEYVKLLLDNGADPNITCHREADFEPKVKVNCAFDTALSKAVAQDDAGALRILVEKGADVNLSSLWTRENPLVIAIRLGHFDCSRFLVEHGADVNADLDDTMYGWPLQAAIEEGAIDCARFLLEQGADVNPHLRYGSDISPLIAAIAMENSGNLSCARLLVEWGADVNASVDRCPFGVPSPLIAAISRGRLDYVRFLIEHGADVNMKLKFGGSGSPLAAALSMGQMDCACILIENGADVNAYLEFGDYSCALAAAILGCSPSLEMVKYPVEDNNADPAQLAFDRPDITQQRAIEGSPFRRKYKYGSPQSFQEEEKRKIIMYLVQTPGSSMVAALNLLGMGKAHQG